MADETPTIGHRSASNEVQLAKAQIAHLGSMLKGLRERNKERSEKVFSPRSSPTKPPLQPALNNLNHERFTGENALSNGFDPLPTISLLNIDKLKPGPVRVKRLHLPLHTRFIRDAEGRIQLLPPARCPGAAQQEFRPEDYLDRNTICEPEKDGLKVWMGFGESEVIGGGSDWVSKRLEHFRESRRDRKIVVGRDKVERIIWKNGECKAWAACVEASGRTWEDRK